MIESIRICGDISMKFPVIIPPIKKMRYLTKGNGNHLNIKKLDKGC